MALELHGSIFPPLCALLSVAATAAAQATVAGRAVDSPTKVAVAPRDVSSWAVTFAGDQFDAAYDAAAVGDGFFLTGVTHSYGAGGGDVWVARLEADGATRWASAIGGPGKDEAHAILGTDDGGCILAGYSASFRGGWIVKLDEHGGIDWQKAYDGLDQTRFAALAPAPDGYYVGGAFQSPITQEDVWILAIDPSGEILWQKVFAGEGTDVLSSLSATADGLVFCANSNSTFGAPIPGVPFFVPWLVRLDADGDVLWQHTYNFSGGDGWSDVVALEDGGFVATGEIIAMGFFRGDVWVVRLDEEGDVLWDRRLGDHFFPFVDAGVKVRPTDQGTFVVAGYSATGDPFENDDDFYLLELDGQGNLLWDRLYGGPGFDDGMALALAPDGDLLLAGFAQSPLTAAVDVLALRLQADGDPQLACDPFLLGSPAPNEWSSGLAIFDPPLVPLDTLLAPADTTGNVQVLDPGAIVCGGG